MTASSRVMASGGARQSMPRMYRGLISTPRSVRTLMVSLILVVVTPLLLFSAYLVLRSAEHEQEIMASTVRERAQTASAAIDRELGALRARLFILAASAHLQTGDLEAFRQQAREITDQLVLTVIVSDPIRSRSSSQYSPAVLWPTVASAGNGASTYPRCCGS